jgi:DnaJ-domain-containing protein 1
MTKPKKTLYIVKLGLTLHGVIATSEEDACEQIGKRLKAEIRAVKRQIEQRRRNETSS